MLRKVGDEIWTSDGSTVAIMGFHYPTRMVIIRLDDQCLFVWSPVTLTKDLRAQVDDLGKVAHIVAPNSLHYLSIPAWQAAYPNALTYAAPKLRDKRQDISFDKELGDVPDPAWIGQIDQVVMQGNLITTEVVFFHIPSGTVIFTDLIQNFPRNWFSGWRRMIAKLDLMTASEATVPRKFRLAFTQRRAARTSVDRITAWPAQLVLMAHGEPITENANGFIARAFCWLKA